MDQETALRSRLMRSIGGKMLPISKRRSVDGTKKRRSSKQSDNSNKSNHSSRSRLWPNMNSGHNTFIEHLAQLLRTELIWKKRSPNATLSAKGKTMWSRINGSSFFQNMEDDESEQDHDEVKGKHATLQEQETNGSEPTKTASNECAHREDSKEICNHCIDAKYAASRLLIDSICDNIEKHLISKDGEEPNNVVDGAMSNQGKVFPINRSVSTDSSTSSTTSSTLFSGAKPTISLNDYLFRCVRYMDRWFHDTPGVRSSGMQSLLCSLIYIQRIRETLPDFQLTELNVHRLVMVTMLISAKFMQDKPITNRYWSKVGGIEVAILNKFETLFVQSTGFNLFVTDKELEILYEEFL